MEIYNKGCPDGTAFIILSYLVSREVVLEEGFQGLSFFSPLTLGIERKRPLLSLNRGVAEPEQPQFTMA